jgi:hypothetical protein
MAISFVRVATMKPTTPDDAQCSEHQHETADDADGHGLRNQIADALLLSSPAR